MRQLFMKRNSNNQKEKLTAPTRHTHIQLNEKRHVIIGKNRLFIITQIKKFIEMQSQIIQI